jgi:hypothetical protein
MRRSLTCRGLEIVALLLILGLASYLRLGKNVDSPGWYADEGTHIIIAQNLARGDVRYMAIGQSTLLFAKLPLFEALLAVGLRLGGSGIGVLRTLTGALGVVSVAGLYGCVRYIKRDPWLALCAALLLATYPQAVLYARFGFSYNLLTPLVLLVYLGLWAYLRDASHRKARRGWLVCAALAIGVGGVSDLWMFTLLVPMMGVVSTRRWRDLVWSVPLVLLPFGVYAASMLVTSPCAFLFDLAFTLSRFSRLSLGAQIRSLALNYATLFSQSHWLALSLVGLFLLRPVRLQRLSLLLLVFPIAFVGRTEALVNLSAYYVIPLLPFVSLGVAVVLREGVPYAQRTVHSALSAAVRRWGWLPGQGGFPLVGAGVIVAAVVLSPFLTSALVSIAQVRSGFSTEIDPFIIDPQDGRAVAEVVNARTDAGDVVIASPGLAWMLDASTADPQMVAASMGLATPHLPPDIPADRWVFEPDYRTAHFVVVDNYWTNWAVYNVAGVSGILDEVEDWPLVFRSGAVEVRCNPRQGDCSNR